MTGDASRTTTRDWGTSAPRHRWRGRDVFYFILAFFALNIIVSPIISVLPFKGESAGAMRVLAGTLFVELTLIGMTAFVLHFAYRLSFFEEMRWARNYEANNGMLLALGAGLAVSVMIVSTLFPPSSPPIERMLSTPGAIALFAVFGIAFAPFLEEMMFRGYLFRVIEDLFNGSVAVRATALMFTIMHVPQLWGSWARHLRHIRGRVHPFRTARAERLGHPLRRGPHGLQRNAFSRLHPRHASSRIGLARTSHECSDTHISHPPSPTVGEFS